MAPKLAAHETAIILNAKLFSASRTCTSAATSSASPTSSGACWSCATYGSCAPAPSSAPSRRRASPRSTSGWRRWRRSSPRTCWPTSRPGASCSANATSPACRIAARSRGARGRRTWGSTASTPSRCRARSIEPFLQFSARRDLREEAFNAWIRRGENGGETDNRAIVAEIVALRAELAALLGYKTYAAYSLEDTMAKTPASVRDLLSAVWEPAVKRAAERARRAAEPRARGRRQLRHRAVGLALLREKERKARFDVDEARRGPTSRSTT